MSRFLVLALTFFVLCSPGFAEILETKKDSETSIQAASFDIQSRVLTIYRNEKPKSEAEELLQTSMREIRDTSDKEEKKDLTRKLAERFDWKKIITDIIQDSEAETMTPVSKAEWKSEITTAFWIHQMQIRGKVISPTVISAAEQQMKEEGRTLEQWIAERQLLVPDKLAQQNTLMKASSKILGKKIPNENEVVFLASLERDKAEKPTKVFFLIIPQK